MSTVQQLLDQLNSASGQTQWHLVGSGAPIESTSVTTVPDPLGIKPPQTVNRGDGQYYVVVQDNSGNQRKMPLVADPNSAVLQNASVHQGGTTTTGPLKVRQTGVNDVDTDASGKQTPRSDIYTGDLSKLDWNSGGPLADVPQGSTTKQPSATDKLDSIDAQGNVVATGSPQAKQMRDPATGTVFNLVTDPKGELHDFGNDVYMVKPGRLAHGRRYGCGQADHDLNVPNVGRGQCRSVEARWAARDNVELAASAGRQQSRRHPGSQRHLVRADEESADRHDQFSGSPGSADGHDG